MMIPLKYNLRYLVTRWSGTLMTALTFALVVAVFVTVMSLARGVERALGSSGNPLNVLVLRPGVQAESQSIVQVDRYYLVREYPGIARDEAGEPLAGPEVQVLVSKPKAVDGKPTNLQVRGVSPASLRLRPEVRLVAGRMFRPGLREVIVARSAAQRFRGMGLGDTTRLGRGQWKIVGLFDARGTAFESELWADYKEIMQEFDRQQYNTVLVRARDAAAVETIRRAADADRRSKLEAKSEAQYYREQTETAARPVKAFSVFLAVIMSIGACFAGMNTMYANVASRVREIGTLRVLGFTPFSILVCFLIESVAMALVGGAIGCAAAWTLVKIFALNPTGTTNFQSFSEVVFYFTVTPDLMLMGLIFAVTMGVIGGLLPAQTAAREPILSALKQI